jgi:exopolysaccharide production protein ExoZ
MVYTTADRNVTPWSFMADRIARIVPIYWLITLAVFCIALVLPMLLQATRADWSELVKSLLFIPFTKANGLAAPMLFVGWTLNYEMFFYLLFALGLAFPGKKAGAVGVICCLVCLVGVGLVGIPENVFGKYYTNPIVLDFVLGVVIGLTHRNIPLHATVSSKIVVAVSVFAGVVAAVLLPLIFPHVSTFVVSGLPSCLIVGGALALEQWGWVIKAGWCLAIGNASYSIYLTHPFVTSAVQKVAAKMQVEAFGSVLLIVGALISVCVVGVLVHHMLERPLSTAVRRLLKARRLNPQIDGRHQVGPA